ncbi:MAG: hypothetical protein ACTSXQ_06265 [Alphaproteobacteria bacterium]
MSEPQPIHAVDVYRLFTAGDQKISLKRFKTKAPLEYTNITEESGLTISCADLVITREERNRFEEKHNIVPFETDMPDVFLYRNNYQDIKIMGERHKLGPIQANIVKHLHQYSQTNNPWAYGGELLKRAGAQSLRLSTVFNRHQNWRDIICSDRRGKYRLNIPILRPQGNKTSLDQLSLFH